MRSTTDGPFAAEAVWTAVRTGVPLQRREEELEDEKKD